MHAERARQWATIETITIQMCDLAASLANLSDDVGTNPASWQKLVDLDKKREQLLKRFFSNPVLNNEAVFLKTALEKIIVLDKELTIRCQFTHKKIQSKLSLIDHQFHAATMYSAVQAG